MSRFAAVLLIALYTALAPGANPLAGAFATTAAGAAWAEEGATARAAALRDGAMKKLAFTEPKDLPDFAFADLDGAERHLSEWQGKWVVLNFWATWCAPCRKEMPSLQALQTALGGADLAVVTVATGRNPPAAVHRFFAETGVTDLQVLLDPKLKFAGTLGIAGLPVTILLDPQGREVARLIGDADWADADALAVMSALLDG